MIKKLFKIGAVAFCFSFLFLSSKNTYAAELSSVSSGEQQIVQEQSLTEINSNNASDLSVSLAASPITKTKYFDTYITMNSNNFDEIMFFHVTGYLNFTYNPGIYSGANYGSMDLVEYWGEMGGYIETASMRSVLDNNYYEIIFNVYNNTMYEGNLTICVYSTEYGDIVVYSHWN